MGKFRINFFWSIVVTLLIVYSLIKWLIPFVSRQIIGMPFPLPVPGALVLFYMVLAIVGLLLYVTFSEEGLDEFLEPIKTLLKGEYGKLPKNTVLCLLPLAVGLQVYNFTVPKVDTPVALRMQHPSSNFPKAMETLKNPLENPTDEELDIFIDQVKGNTLEFIPQVKADIDAWMVASDAEHMFEFFPTEPVKKMLQEVKGGKISRKTAKAALHEKRLFEGRTLYAMNCRPCHGSSVAGDGPMAGGFKLRPTNFTDNGTIETIVEGYTFWRVANGGPGLPVEATPWDSAMPEWKINLSEEEIWKVIMAEYDMAGKMPRMPDE